MTQSNKEPLVCIVDRKTWARGTQVPAEAADDDEKNHLLNSDGTRCCLGFLGKCVGVSDEDMLETALPDNLSIVDFHKYPDVPDIIWGCFARANDSLSLTEEERESNIQALAKEYGFEFQFVGE
jgi:hypothetical protein